jgi:hypothetical protein
VTLLGKLKRELLLSVKRGDVTYDTSLSHLPSMRGEDAAKLFDDDPSKLWMTLGNIASLFGMTIEELQVDLVDGKLRAHMLDNEDGTQSIAVNAEELTKWMVLTGRQPTRD